MSLLRRQKYKPEKPPDDMVPTTLRQCMISKRIYHSKRRVLDIRPTCPSLFLLVNALHSNTLDQSYVFMEDKGRLSALFSLLCKMIPTNTCEYGVSSSYIRIRRRSSFRFLIVLLAQVCVLCISYSLFCVYCSLCLVFSFKY